MTTAFIQPAFHWEGTLQVPGDKSISHRAVMLSSLAEGTSTLHGLLKGEDVRATMNCFRAMGVKIEERGEEVLVHGVGLKGLRAPEVVLDCGNSGTTMRLMMGILAAQPFVSRLTGDASLNRRPMGRVIEPLKQMGAQIEELRASETERVIRIQGRPLHGISYEMPMASAQVKSALLLAGLYASGVTEVIEPMPSRNHSELMLKAKGVSLEIHQNKIQIFPPEKLLAQEITVPGDISSAAFFLVAGTLAKTGEVCLKNVGVNPTRDGLIEVLQTMGASLELENKKEMAGEWVADLRVRPASLKGTTVAGALIPRLIDEIPVLAVAAARAVGTTHIREAAELRVKESDRIANLAQELRKFSINIIELEDGMDIEGPNEFSTAQVDSHGDHRLAMSGAIAAAFASGPCEIHSVDCIQTSFPDFWQHYESLGGQVSLKK